VTEYRLIHLTDQGGCGKVAWITDQHPQDMVEDDIDVTHCRSCGRVLHKWNFRVRNFEEVGR